MTVNTPKTIAHERFQRIKPAIEKKLTYKEVLRVCSHSRRSLERWIKNYKNK